MPSAPRRPYHSAKGGSSSISLLPLFHSAALTHKEMERLKDELINCRGPLVSLFGCSAWLPAITNQKRRAIGPLPSKTFRSKKDKKLSSFHSIPINSFSLCWIGCFLLFAFVFFGRSHWLWPQPITPPRRSKEKATQPKRRELREKHTNKSNLSI